MRYPWDTWKQRSQVKILISLPYSADPHMCSPERDLPGELYEVTEYRSVGLRTLGLGGLGETAPLSKERAAVNNGLRATLGRGLDASAKEPPPSARGEPAVMQTFGIERSTAWTNKYENSPSPSFISPRATPSNTSLFIGLILFTSYRPENTDLTYRTIVIGISWIYCP